MEFTFFRFGDPSRCSCAIQLSSEIMLIMDFRNGIYARPFMALFSDDKAAARLLNEDNVVISADIVLNDKIKKRALFYLNDLRSSSLLGSVLILKMISASGEVIYITPDSSLRQIGYRLNSNNLHPSVSKLISQVSNAYNGYSPILVLQDKIIGQFTSHGALIGKISALIADSSST